MPLGFGKPTMGREMNMEMEIKHGAQNTRLSHPDLGACTGVLYRLYEAVPLAGFARHLPRLISDIVPIDRLGCNDVDAWPKPVFQTPANEAAWPPQEAAVYKKIHRRQGARHQLVCFVRDSQARRIRLTFERESQDFSERDRQVLLFLAPHVARAYIRCGIAGERASGLEQLGEGLAAVHRAVILSDTSGRISWSNGLAREWLKEFFPDYDERSGLLPLSLTHWCLQSEHRARQGLPVIRELQTATVGTARLVVYYGCNPDGSLVLVLMRERQNIDPQTLAALGLTEREGQILFWMSEAKTSPEIAAILGISLRTIHKHSEHIFAKLSLANRLEAQRLGLELRRI